MLSRWGKRNHRSSRSITVHNNCMAALRTPFSYRAEVFVYALCTGGHRERMYLVVMSATQCYRDSTCGLVLKILMRIVRHKSRLKVEG